MGDSIHGHEVLHLMQEHGGGFTRETLRDAIIACFGSEARFHTCSADDLTADQLIEFLAARGKFVAGEGGFNTQPHNTCDH